MKEDNTEEGAMLGNSEDVNQERPNNATANITILSEHDGLVEVLYSHKFDAPQPSKQVGNHAPPPTFKGLMGLVMPTGTGKTALSDAYMEVSPMPAEERAKLEAEKLEKARLYEESAKQSGIPTTREEIEVYVDSRWDDYLVSSFNHRGCKGREDVVCVGVQANPDRRFEKTEFTEALEANNPGLFRDVFIDDENGYWGWDDTLISFTGASGTRFTVSCYKIRRGDFYVYMGAGLHAGKAPITAENFRELEAIIETFRYLNSLPAKHLDHEAGSESV